MVAGFKLKANGAGAGGKAPASQPVDEMQVNRALSIFLDPDHSVFLQALPAELGSICLPASSHAEIANWITSHASGRGVYFAINPCNPIERPMRVADAVYRRWILIDVDRHKFLQPDDPATEYEHGDAKELAFEVMEFLTGLGFPAPIQIDSGNGFHLYYRIQLPNDEIHRDLVHDFLKLLDSTFTGEKGSIGSECFDARRISRMPGTWSRRGRVGLDRPYRQCKFVYSPKELQVVPVALLQAVVGGEVKTAEPIRPAEPAPIQTPASSSFKMKASGQEVTNELPTNPRFLAAEKYVAAGISVVPVKADGSKAPAIGQWKGLQEHLPTNAELVEWFGDNAQLKGLATISGKISGNLELIDFDIDAERVFPEWEALVQSIMPGLLDKVHVAKTPRGYHVRYRCADAVIPGNQKLAETKDTKLALIETRGEGGYALAPGCPPECHETKRDYHDRDGSMVGLLSEPITCEEREVLLDAARSLDEANVVEPANDPNGQSFKLTASGSSQNETRPSDDYNRRAEWHDVLAPAGWRWVGRRGDILLWCRPGKQNGVSATTGFCKSEMRGDLLKVFSSNATPLEAKAYSKFEAYTFLYCNGDFKKASAELGRKGWGAAAKQSKKTANNTTSHSTSNAEYLADPNSQITIRASKIVPRSVEWLWYGRLPLRKMTTFAGVGGIGKTFVLCDIAARVSSGAVWPFENGECAKVGKVLYISGEDDPDDTLVPRMIACGANLENIFFMRMAAQDRFSVADIRILDRAFLEMGDDVRFVVIDPPSSFLLGVDNHKDSEVRSLLTPLKNWVEKSNVALVFNAHLNKGASGKTDAMMRVMGTVAWVNAVRAAHLFAQDPDDPDKFFFVPMKMNLCKKRKGLGYTIASTDDLAKVQWIDEVDITANEAVSGENRPQSRRENAAEWLVEKFKEKLEWESDDLFKAAKHEGISRPGIFEAKKLLNLPKAKKVIHLGGASIWVWWVPEGWKPPEKNTVTVEPVENEEAQVFE